MMQFQSPQPWLMMEKMMPIRSCRQTESGTSLAVFVSYTVS